MNGVIIPHTPIAVDIWSIRKTAASNCRLFFLSHAHTDHTMGLTSSWKEHKIYTSEVTKKIVGHKIGVSIELLVGLPVDQPVEIPMDEVGKEKLTVTLIDANHCPGAVLFLFEGYFGTILYTGDFRYYKSLTAHPVLKDKEIDKLYLDNTYCDPLCMFPSRDEATTKVLDIVQDHLNKDFHIVIGLNSLGKEGLLVEVGVRFQTWIGVNPKRMSLLKLLDLPDVFTCDVASTRIKVVMPRQISKFNLQAWNESHPTIAILPTSLFEGDVNIYQYMSNVFVVPLSDHSSYGELQSFVSEVKPKEIVPIVLKHKSSTMESTNSRVNMSVFSSYLNKEPFSAITIPETVLQFMGSGSTKSRSNKRTNPQMKSTQLNKRRRCSGVVFHDDEDVSEGQSSPSLHSERESTVEPKRLEIEEMLNHNEKDSPTVQTKQVQETVSLHDEEDVSEGQSSPSLHSERESTVEPKILEIEEMLNHNEKDSPTVQTKQVQETVSLHDEEDVSEGHEKEPTVTSEIFQIEGPSHHEEDQEPTVERKGFHGILSLHNENQRTLQEQPNENKPSVEEERFKIEELQSHQEKDQEPTVERKEFQGMLSLHNENQPATALSKTSQEPRSENKPSVEEERFKIEELQSQQEKDQEPTVVRKRFRGTLSFSTEKEPTLTPGRFEIERTIISCQDERECEPAVVAKRTRTQGTLDQYLLITRQEDYVKKNIPSKRSYHDTYHDTCNQTKNETDDVMIKKEDRNTVDYEHNDNDNVEHTKNAWNFCDGKIFKKCENSSRKEMASQNLQNAPTRKLSQSYQSPVHTDVQTECDSNITSSRFAWLSNSFTDASCGEGKKPTRTSNSDTQERCETNTYPLNKESGPISSDSDDDSSLGFNWFTTFKCE